jgi:NAD(P)-dependent dehydrogenase (short-subunit alcohol dehydrogenase family)
MTKRTALITGASRGLGAVLAEGLALRGWDIIAVARTSGALEELDDRVKSHKSPGAGALTLAPMDITDVGAVQNLCLNIYNRWGGLNLWAHCAIHTAPMAPAGSVDMKDWDKSVNINTRATGVLIPMIEPLLRDGSGTALFFDDPRAGHKFFAAYGASKSAQIALARSWAAETAKTGPRVLIDTPAPMPTATRARFFPGEDRSKLADIRSEALRIIDLI